MFTESSIVDEPNHHYQRIESWNVDHHSASVSSVPMACTTSTNSKPDGGRSSLDNSFAKRPLPPIPQEPEDAQPQRCTSGCYTKHESRSYGFSRWHSRVNRTKYRPLTGTETEPDGREKQKIRQKRYSFQTLPSLNFEGSEDRTSSQSESSSPIKTSVSSSCRLRRQSPIRRQRRGAYQYYNRAQSTFSISEPRRQERGEYSNRMQLVRGVILQLFLLKVQITFFSIKILKQIV